MELEPTSEILDTEKHEYFDIETNMHKSMDVVINYGKYGF